MFLTTNVCLYKAFFPQLDAGDLQGGFCCLIWFHSSHFMKMTHTHSEDDVTELGCVCVCICVYGTFVLFALYVCLHTVYIKIHVNRIC